MLEKIELEFNQDPGAPEPLVFWHDNLFYLIFYLLSDEVQVAILKFDYVIAHRNNYVYTNETLSKHSLSEVGLEPYEIFILKESIWIKELSITRSLSHLNHYIFTFHDSLFECVAKGFKYEIKSMTIMDAFKEVIKLK